MKDPSRWTLQRGLALKPQFPPRRKQGERDGGRKGNQPEIGGTSPSVLQKAGVGEREVVCFAADDVVEDADAEEVPGLVEADGALAVLPAGGGVARRMVVLCAAPSYVTQARASGIFVLSFGHFPTGFRLEAST